MWSYYGSKANVVNYHPPPKHGKIIEPFAGTARYSLKYFDRDVLLVDKYDVIVKIWKWLQKCSEKDIKSLPRFKHGENINQHNYNCEEERMLIGFLVGFGFATPRDTATVRLKNRPNAMNYTIGQIAKSLFKIRHWEIRCDSYENIPNEPATWFIDPPYEKGGHAYARNNKKIDFGYLAGWCRNREGHVIVCETMKATWMDFKPLAIHRTRSGCQSEAIWSNQPTAYDVAQIKLFI